MDAATRTLIDLALVQEALWQQQAAGPVPQTAIDRADAALRAACGGNNALWSEALATAHQVQRLAAMRAEVMEQNGVRT